MPAANPPVTTSAIPGLAGIRVSDLVVSGLLVLLALFALYAVFFDQGVLLSGMFGDTAYDSNYLHEFAHDGRHLFGMPCH
jgi:Probable cobalt transporter subunit (CbtB)